YGSDVRSCVANMELNGPFVKGDLGKLIDFVFKKYGTEETSIMLDKMKDQGFKFATVAGVTVSISDIKVVDGKYEMISEGDKEVERITKFYNKGLLTDDERHKKVCDVWANVKKRVQKALESQLRLDN